MEPLHDRAEQLLSRQDGDALARLEQSLIESSASLDEQIAVKLARSKARLQRSIQPVHLSVVFAMYKETARMLPPDEHPAGEDFINRKAEQLRWLFDGDAGWQLLMVDDGCPDGSGRLAEQKIIEAGLAANARVLYLSDAIDGGHYAASGLASTDESRKGGSILFGMAEAAARPAEGHVVVYTDADISTNLAQAGLLVGALEGGAVCAAGSRREPTSVAVKTGVRNDRGKLFIYLWKQMLTELRDIVDTQCGFKGFRAEAVPELVADTIEKQFAFDIELLLRCVQGDPDAVTRVPIAWVDSEEASTTTDLEPYLPMLKAVARMYRHYASPNRRGDEFADVVEHLDPDGWERLVENVPAEILEREPVEFVEWAGVGAERFR